MSLHFMSTTPAILLSTFKTFIDNGNVVTWSYDGDGDFTHCVDQWEKKARVRPVIRQDKLLLTIIKPRNENISKVVYGVYHGRFIESMLTHCDELFSQALATAVPSDGDMVKD
jgi:hypothetical protein